MERARVRCPVHGIIDVSDATAGTSVLEALVRSAPMLRLRRIKQLGFTSWEYAGADHSRFSHSLGTMHVMRKMLAQLGRDDGLWTGLRGRLDESVDDSDDSLRQHLLVAALLQDCGELPYGQATSWVFSPDDDVVRAVAELTNEHVDDIREWPSKAVFTVACIDELQPILGSLDPQLIAYLITGGLWREQKPDLHAAMQLLDGVVDADRIDYVARDAHHTGVGGVAVDAVIASLLHVDSEGPTFSDPVPVAELLAVRAHLYSTVYLSGSNRFRTMLVRTLLEGVDASDSDDLRRVAFGTPSPRLGMVRFLLLDDVAVEAIIDAVQVAPTRSHLSARASAALRALTGEEEYRLRWVRSDDAVDQAEPLDLPSGYFGEYFEDPTRDDQRLVRVRLAQGEKPVPLNTLSGPYCGVVTHASALLPIRGDVLILEPARRQPPARYRAATRAGWLGAGVKEGLVHRGRLDDTDTTHTAGFTGPSVFISYCVEDLPVVTAIVEELRRRKRRYYLIARPFQGVGGTPAANSEDAPRRTDACLMVVSVAYQDRIRNQPQGNIVKELRVASERHALDGYPIVPLTTVHFSAVDGMPWQFLGFDGIPYMGRPLRPRDRDSISEAVGEALEVIDAELSSRP